MSNKNYRNYQNYQKGKEQTPDPEPAVGQIGEKFYIPETVIEPTEENSADTEPADNTDDTVESEPVKTEIGKVNCIRLKIRNKPSMGGSIVCLARVGDELTIDRSKYYDGWLKVTTVDGLEGFCKQDFVTVI
nr:MAG TPA: SH3 domain protein [Caudoviricetes sp.]